MISTLSEQTLGRNVVGFSTAVRVITVSGSFTYDDLGKVLELNSGSSITLTLPVDADAPFAVGDLVHVRQTGTGQGTIAGGSTTLVSEGNKFKLVGQWAIATLEKRAANSWVIYGNLTSV